MKPLGKPVNNLVKSCEDVTATCVIWDGPNISADCLGIQIYQGDSIVPIVYNTFKRFCELLQKIDLSAIDSSCIIDLTSPPDQLVELINLINEKLCENNVRITKEENKAYAANIAGLPFCLQIKSDTITITRLPLDEQLGVVSSKVCEELQDIENLKSQLDPSFTPTPDIYVQLDELQDQIDAQCSVVVPDVTLTCIAPIGIPMPVEEAYQLLEKAFCTFRNFTGTPSELQAAIARDCPNLSSLPALSNTGLMSDIYGWIDSPINVAQSMSNLWLTICDLRTAIRKILDTCCADTPCLSFDIGYKLNFDPNDQFVEVIFQDFYNGPTPVLPPGPPSINWISRIFNLDRTASYLSTPPPYPAWLDQTTTSDFFDISTVQITLNDGSGDFTQDTGLTIMQLMEIFPFGYQFNYPAGYNPQALAKTINIEFTYSHVLKITNALPNIPSPGKVTYQTATKHPFVVGSRVDIMNVNPSTYDNMDIIVTSVTSAYEFVVTTPTIPALGAYVSGGNVIQSSQTRNCEECACCCTYSITNGLY